MVGTDAILPQSQANRHTEYVQEPQYNDRRNASNLVSPWLVLFSFLYSETGILATSSLRFFVARPSESFFADDELEARIYVIVASVLSLVFVALAFQFTSRDARHKLERLYPVKETRTTCSIKTAVEV